ncbi:MAG: hypothetical protein V4801_37835 [Burkholderia gladioli]
MNIVRISRRYSISPRGIFLSSEAFLRRDAPQQRNGIEQVGKAVTEMDTVTQQNAALVEQAAAAASSLDEQATRLRSAVAVFRIA